MTSVIQSAHIPVLAQEVISLLSPLAGKVVVDCTFGAGGYSRLLLENGANVIAIDKDPSVQPIAIELQHEYPDQFQFIQGDFCDIKHHLASIDLVDAIVADIGVSSMQLDQAERGFSFMQEARLDMRMNPEGLSAYEVVNNMPEEDLANIIYQYGEERASRRIARSIVQHRENHGNVETTTELAHLVRRACTYNPKAKIDSATKTFQAIRIHVNGELDALQTLLNDSIRFLKAGGKLAIVTFHSLEDSIVKAFLKENCAPKIARSKYAKISDEETKFALSTISKKPIIPTKEEQKVNPRARSAKLRIASRTTLGVLC